MRLVVLSLISMLAASAFAGEIIPVTTLDEVPSGIAYDVVQPPVTNPNLLGGKHVAILAAHGVQEQELTFPLEYLQRHGATVDILAPAWSEGRLLAVQYTKPTLWVSADGTFSDGIGRTYDLLVLTGGAWNATVVRNDADALALVRTHRANGRPLAAICAGSLVLVDAGIARGATMTGTHSARIDIVNAGATYLDQEVVVSNGLITSRSPDDLPAFVTAIAKALTTESH